ncbi:transcription termination factor MTEF18, mitochondrial [Punica granatum]|uniref:Transcription termination factor MTEF18, mitochondrial n=1 Tax=Punica granatum TaxID=22663 RepID=A0A6P8DHT8_PUNGR|nr:transcription termination factor MTEF18, mitochondrial [Punica granatum]
MRPLHTLARHFSTAANLPKIPYKHRPRALREARQALTDYLHSTKSLPFTFADLIARNSPSSLSDLISPLDFSSPSDFSRTLHKHLRYHPINEFEFFFESIGINHREIDAFLPRRKFFLSEDRRCLEAACALYGFGFSWNRLGELYREQASIFSRTQEELSSRLCELKNGGFSSDMVIAICFTFPRLLIAEGCEFDALFDDLKRLLLDAGLESSVEANVDSWCKVCRTIRLFYELGFEEGSVRNSIIRCIGLFLGCPEEVLVQKVSYFSRFGVCNREVGSLFLHRPEVLGLDLETPAISVVGLLKHFGLSAAELEDVSRNYPHVLGRSRMANLPQIMRAMNLHIWFLSRMREGDHELLASYVMSEHDADLDKGYMESLVKIKSSRCCVHSMSKLNFLHGIGFGENALTIWVLANVHGSSSELQERFNCLLRLGIEFWKLCRMISSCPRLLSQRPETLEQKVNFLRNEMGSSLDYLDIFPAFLCFDLENRIRPRCSFHMWLVKNGLCARSYTFASIIATSEKKYMARLYWIHPAIVKIWLEHFSCKRI